MRASDVRIEPDLSNAAPFLARPMITGGSVTVPGWPRATTQAGDALRACWPHGRRGDPGGDGVLTVTGTGTVRGLDADLHDVGELTPSVAALCPSPSPSRLRGMAHIRGHETDRMAALATELSALGARVTEHEDGLRPRPLHGGVFHTYADHRMATTAAVIGPRPSTASWSRRRTHREDVPGLRRRVGRAVRR